MSAELRSYQLSIFSCLFIGYALYILCRKSFGFVIPLVVEKEGLSKEDAGIIASSLSAAYAVSKFVIGVLSDHISARVLFSLGLVSSGTTVLAFSRTSGLSFWSFLWFCNGMAQGCGWPSCAKLLRKWFKPSQLGTVWSLLSASMNVTGAVVPIALPFLLAVTDGWRGFMLTSGIISVISGLIALAFVKDSPSDCNLPEIVPEAKKNDRENTKGSNESAKWSSLLSSSFLWRLSFYYFVTFSIKTSVENWAQLLLMEEKNLSAPLSATFISSFEIGGMISSFATGYITDWFMLKQTPSPRASNPRMIMVTCYMLISGLALAATASTKVFLPLIAFLLGAATYGNINIYGIVATEEAPSHLSGSSHAIVSLAANVGAILAGYPISLLASITSLTFTFYLQAVICALCNFMMILTRSGSTKIAHVD